MSDHRIEDYADKDYSSYWRSAERRYFDTLERPTVSALLPEKGHWFADLGCGFGRFKDLYLDRFDNIILLDYSENLLRQAQAALSPEARKRVHLVLGDLYHLPIRKDALDAAMLVRVFHHIETPADTLAEIQHVIRPGGTFLLNYYNRRNIREILRYLVTRSGRDPHTVSHENFSEDSLLFYSHPQWIETILSDLWFTVQERRSVGLFYGKLVRIGLGLAPLECLFSGPLGRAALALEVFLKTLRNSDEEPRPCAIDLASALACPACKEEGLLIQQKSLCCEGCDRTYPIHDGIYDLRLK